ncbi:myoD family inhibitor [Corythoichthys intestinalis]|uniref:myoD family inhibitor n=1 Tax=Corythoichthys intestinalis TaxID=161448 RepID=UPI0025A633DD|nr:myoD family inhibitor [Corythoichthys intestinalis]
MDTVTSHHSTPGMATECPDQFECISIQPTTGRTHLLQSADQVTTGLCDTPETQKQADITNVITDVISEKENLPEVSPPLPACTNEKHLYSRKKHTTFKTNAALINEVAGDDCGAHCLLACLFCEFQSMCWAAERFVTCGGRISSCCWFVDTCCWFCCCCWNEACTVSLDCGVLEECCSSADCLEICLECCAICFPS